MPDSFKVRGHAFIQKLFSYEYIINPYYVCMHIVICYLSAKMHLKYYLNLQEVQTPTHHKKIPQINYRKGYFLIFFSISVRPYPTLEKTPYFFLLCKVGRRFFFQFSPCLSFPRPRTLLLERGRGPNGFFFFLIPQLHERVKGRHRYHLPKSSLPCSNKYFEEGFLQSGL